MIRDVEVDRIPIRIGSSTVLDEWHKKYPYLKLKHHAKNAKKMRRVITQATLRSYRETPIISMESKFQGTTSRRCNLIRRTVTPNENGKMLRSWR